MIKTETLRLASHDNFYGWVYNGVNGADNPIGAELSADTYAEVTAPAGRNAELYFYYSFSPLDIPKEAVISSVTCSVKAKTHGEPYIYSSSACLLCGTEIKGAEALLGTDADVIVFDGGTWSRDELMNARIRLYGTRQSYMTSLIVGITLYAAELTVTYELLVPETITVLLAESGDNGVNLSWDSAEDAAGYNIYRDGVRIASTSGTAYRDEAVEPYMIYSYSVAAYNDYGEGGKAGASKSVLSARDILLDLIFDRTAVDLADSTDKGNYNASDLNRVAAAVNYISAMFAEYGCSVPDECAADWRTNDLPLKNKISDHHAKTLADIGLISYPGKPEKIPESLERLTIDGANAIERALYSLIIAGRNIPESWHYSGELYGGEI